MPKTGRKKVEREERMTAGTPIADPGTAGQSGDEQGLPDTPVADSESVAELAEEGQSFEAEVIEAVENAPDPDASEVKTRQLPEDDVPPEYLNPDQS